MDTTINLSELNAYELTVTFNGLVAVRHRPCGNLTVLPAGQTQLGDAVRIASQHTCHYTAPTPEPKRYTDQELIDRGLMHLSSDGILTVSVAAGGAIDPMKSHVLPADLEDPDETEGEPEPILAGYLRAVKEIVDGPGPGGDPFPGFFDAESQPEPISQTAYFRPAAHRG